ncbi:MAG: Ldh family oxidoreductase [Actinomycetes bacterium]
MTEGGDARTRLLGIDDLRACLTAAFERLDLATNDAEGLAGLLVDSELRGHPDHGIGALELLVRLYREGTLQPRPRVRVLRESDTALLLDGDRGCGPGAPMQAMQWCVERARERQGMAVAVVRDWQMLVAAPFVRHAAEAGLIGFACTNYSPLLAPPGGRMAVFGTNPLAYAVPARRHPPVVLDIATSVMAALKVRAAAQEGRTVPEGAVLRADGQTTDDPSVFLEGGLLAPLGYPLAAHKGFGLALVVDVLSGVLSGAGFGQAMTTPTPGIFFWALDIEAFMPREEFLQRMDSQLDQIKQGERLPGVSELFLPGERGQRRHAELTARGVVPVTPGMWDVLVTTCAALDAPLPTVREV